MDIEVLEKLYQKSQIRELLVRTTKFVGPHSRKLYDEIQEALK